MKKFVSGVVFAMLGIPILEGLSELVLNWFEVAKVPAIKMTLQGNKEIADLQEECEYQVKPSLIGFQGDESEEYYED